MKSLAILAVITWALILGRLPPTSVTEAFQGDQPRKATDSRVEDIYIARSMHESKITPTPFCAEGRTGIGSPISEDQYTFRSTTTRGTDGLMIDTNVQTIGRLHACFGSTTDPALRSFYAEGVLATVTFTGRGECRMAKADYPEPGLTVSRCFLELRELPSGYVGGQLTTNTMGSRNELGEETDPSGYTQPSIATIRLWKRR
jgi:hypothetical protein